jgi:hypothetical protein
MKTKKTSRKKSQTKHSSRRRTGAALRRNAGTRTAVIPIAVQDASGTKTRRAARARKSASPAVIPVVLQSPSATSHSSKAGLGAVGDTVAVIPVATKTVGVTKSTARSRKRRRKKAVIRVAVRTRTRQTRRTAARQTSASSRQVRMSDKRGLLPQTLDQAIELERNTVETVGGVSKLALDVLQNAASLIVTTPAAFLGMAPRPALPTTGRQNFPPHLNDAPSFALAA